MSFYKPSLLQLSSDNTRCLVSGVNLRWSSPERLSSGLRCPPPPPVKSFCNENVSFVSWKLCRLVFYTPDFGKWFFLKQNKNVYIPITNQVQVFCFPGVQFEPLGEENCNALRAMLSNGLHILKALLLAQHNDGWAHVLPMPHPIDPIY